MSQATWDRRTKDFEEAAGQILRDSNEPLKVQNIARKAVERGLISPVGKTPDRFMYLVIRRANARRAQEGSPHRFLRHERDGRVYYSVAE